MFFIKSFQLLRLLHLENNYMYYDVLYLLKLLQVEKISNFLYEHNKYDHFFKYDISNKTFSLSSCFSFLFYLDISLSAILLCVHYHFSL
jgi:hypothetical protein